MKSSLVQLLCFSTYPLTLAAFTQTGVGKDEVTGVLVSGCFGADSAITVGFWDPAVEEPGLIFYWLAWKRFRNGRSKQLKVWMLTELGYNSMLLFTIIHG